MDAAVLANVVLSLPLLIVVVVALALNNLYSKAPGQVLKSSFTELRDIVYGLGISGCVVLGIDQLFGPFERQATMKRSRSCRVAVGGRGHPDRAGSQSCGAARGQDRAVQGAHPSAAA